MYSMRSKGQSLKIVKRNLSSNSNALNQKNMKLQNKKCPHSLKPIGLVLSSDIYQKGIYINMAKQNNAEFFTFLSEETKRKRSQILNYFKSFSSKVKLPIKILCSAIYLFDILINKTELVEKISYEFIGIGAMLLATKFNCLDNGAKKTKSFLDFYDKNLQIKFKDINIAEIECLKSIGYFLSYVYPINFLEIILVNGIVFDSDIGISPKELKSNIYFLPIEILEHIMMVNYNYVIYNPFHLSCGIIALCRELYSLDKWPEMFIKMYNINFEGFKPSFIFVKENYKTKIEKTPIQEKSKAFIPHPHHKHFNPQINNITQNVNIYINKINSVTPIKKKKENEKDKKEIQRNKNEEVNIIEENRNEVRFTKNNFPKNIQLFTFLKDKVDVGNMMKSTLNQSIYNSANKTSFPLSGKNETNNYKNDISENDSMKNNISDNKGKEELESYKKKEMCELDKKSPVDSNVIINNVNVRSKVINLNVYQREGMDNKNFIIKKYRASSSMDKNCSRNNLDKFNLGALSALCQKNINYFKKGLKDFSNDVFDRVINN